MVLFCNCRARVFLHPVGVPVAPGWDAVKGRMDFYAHAPSFEAGGMDDLGSGTDRCYITLLGMSLIP